MQTSPNGILPKTTNRIGGRGRAPIRVAPELLKAAESEPAVVLKELETSAAGLTEAQAARRLAEYGPNVVARETRFVALRLFFRAVLNPLVILLLVLAAVSQLTGDTRAAVVMGVMVVLGVGLRFVQEYRADTAAARLRGMIRVTATVVRDGRDRELPLDRLVPGDVVRLAAGDMIPADARIVSCKDLFVIQSHLTGETFPVEKAESAEPGKSAAPLELKCVCYLGTSVESGTGLAVAVATGRRTLLGGMATAITEEGRETSFDRGVRHFTWLMIGLISVMVPLVFVINGLARHGWKEAFFFALAVAVGLTPEMLPMIVTVCLSKGALAMSRRRVIVKRLNSIQNLGAMDVLCTDKTGTLTMDRVTLVKRCDVLLREDDGVLALAYLNSYFQTGLKNLMDRAVLEFQHLHEQQALAGCEKMDEIPFDFNRRLMSVVVRTPDGRHLLVCKGAPEAVFKRCTRFELDGETLALEPALLGDLREEFDRLSSDGFRVLAIAYKDLPPKASCGKDDECELVLRGYVAFLDPPKETAHAALAELGRYGIAVKVLTGDNDLVSKTICRQVGVPADEVLLGERVESMSDDDLGVAAERVSLFARLSPAHKHRIIRALQARGHAVGFLGDGINDAPALRAADVGVSVDTAVDVAKESADAILLEKDLLVLADGVVEGRKVFANILKYIRMGASSNFGNVFSVLGGSIFLPFVPMTPIQILTNNLLYDFSQVPIPTDNVDPEQVARPRPWSMNAIFRFIVLVGPCSSLFDYTTFFLMLYAFGCWDPGRASLFQTGWFVESLLTQTLIIHVIRTNRVPFLQSRASTPLLVTTATIMAVGVWLPTSSLGPALGFTPLPGPYWPALVLTLFGYMALTQGVKAWLLRRGWL
jgi:Mg2+-importing ATPase